MKKSKRLWIILLTALLVSGNMVSCGQTTSQEETQESSDIGTMETVPEAVPETTIESAITQQYADVNYNGDDFEFLSPAAGGWPYHKIGQNANEIAYDSINGEAYNDAVYSRNLLTEDLLNIKITTNFTPADFFDFAPTVEKLVMSGDTSIDAALGGLAHQMNLAASGHLLNLYPITSLELDKPWFDQNIIHNYGYKGEKLYCVTGAFTIFDDICIPVIYYGKDIQNAHGLEDPSELVKEGKWTIDKMMTMAETTKGDLNGDGQYTLKDDSFGLLDNTGVMIHMMEATGNPMTKVGNDGIPYINVLTETYTDVAEYIFTQVISNDALFVSNEYADMRNCFMDNRSLFIYEMLVELFTFRNMESSFSLLPSPKLNEMQEDYVAPVNSVWCSTLSIPKCVADPERTGTVLNVLSAYSVNTVETALYELLLGAKLVRDEETVVMLDYALENKQYCMGNGYGWAGGVSSVLNEQVSGRTFTVASGMQAISKQIQKDFESYISEIYED